MHTMVRRNTQPELDSLPYQWSCRPAPVDEASGGVQHGLHSVPQVCRGTHNNRVTLIQLSDTFGNMPIDDYGSRPLLYSLYSLEYLGENGLILVELLESNHRQ